MTTTSKRVRCNLCNGTGQEYGEPRGGDPCLRCGGTGYLRKDADGTHHKEASR